LSDTNATGLYGANSETQFPCKLKRPRKQTNLHLGHWHASYFGTTIVKILCDNNFVRENVTQQLHCET